MATRVQLRRGPAAQWTAANPILAAGEPAVETDTGKLKVGDGTTAWASLPYILDEADLADSATLRAAYGTDVGDPQRAELDAARTAALAAEVARADAAYRPVPLSPTGTNDQTRINAAATAAIAAGASGVVELAAGTFAWDAAIGAWTSGFTLRGQGRDKTFIQLGAGVLNGPRWEGTRTQIGGDDAFTTTAAGATTLTTSANFTGTLAAGDIIILSSDAYFAARPYYNVAEWALVAAVTSTTLTLKWPTRHAYDSTANTLQIHKYTLVDGVRVEDLTIIGHPTATVRQVLTYAAACYRPEYRRVGVRGQRASVGIDLIESWAPVADSCVALDIMDLANSVVGTWTGYGVRTWGTLDATVSNLLAQRCRHAFDDSSGPRLPPSLRTQVLNGRAYDSHSTGWSTHGGSDECLFRDVVAENCGGGFIVRGRAAKGRGAIVHGVTNPTSNAYTALGGVNQSYLHGLTVGEDIDVGGGVISPAGTRLDWEFAECDMVGGSSATHGVYARYTDLLGARILPGNLRIYGGGYGVYSRAYKVRDTFIGTGIITTVTGAGRGVEVSATPAADGNNQRNLVVEGITFDGYANACVTVVGNSVTGANASDGIVIRRNVARNKAAAYTASSSVWRIESGYFSTTAGAVQIRDNAARESDSFAVKTDQANGGTGLGTGLTAKGNVLSTGYDASP